MSVATSRVPRVESPGSGRVARREPREDLVRRVEYCRFPRVRADQRLRIGATRDLSASGLCLRAEEAEPVGALLRIALCALDGHAGPEAIARVAWTAPVGDGSHWVGLAVVAAPRGMASHVHASRAGFAQVA